MFEEMSRLAERLSRVAPTDAEVADPDQPFPDRMRALVDELVLQQRVTAASEGRSMVIMAELCKWAEQWQHVHDKAARRARRRRPGCGRDRPRPAPRAGHRSDPGSDRGRDQHPAARHPGGHVPR